ncbi:hypothetical protein ABL78_3457 [Leptomonas seymouri]|uniref:Uncharacterized protein n=1 Tax=Leptomonas seymouri TaxID=5684 RepID=A0A0N1IL01_LEPSE|nr:hypothetical protein ABL78_3457 [Leptomonas seymouri]|eukprot:KPI87468.1 hypothetical protein ABL78_3457 [Leptomonas seymouri]
MMRLAGRALQCWGSATRACRKAAARSPSLKKRAVARSLSKKKGSPRKALSRKGVQADAAARLLPSPLLMPNMSSQVSKEAEAAPQLPAAQVTGMPPLPHPSRVEGDAPMPLSSSQRTSTLSFSRATMVLITPRTLHSRLRSVVVQLVLLSPEPLQPSALYALFDKVVDAETRSMLACASHAVRLYTSKKLSHAKPQEPRKWEQSTALVDKVLYTDCGTTNEAEVSPVELMSIGKAFVSAYRCSIHPLVEALRNAEKWHHHTTVDAALITDPSAAQTVGRSDGADVPACWDVAEWMFLHTLFCDPEFRVSVYSGAVCYPALPSLLLAHSDRMKDACRIKGCYALQWATGSAPSTTTTTTAAAAASREGKRAYLSHLTSAPPTTVPGSSGSSSTSLPEHAPNFLWLNGSAGCPPWTLAHSEYAMYDAYFSHKLTAESSTATQEEKSESRAATAAAAAMTLEGLTGTSGHRLVDYFILQSASMRVMGEAAADGDGLIGSDRAAARAFPAMGWNEGRQGSLLLQQYVNELADADGQYGFSLLQCATMRQPSGELYRANLRLMGGLFRHLLSVPISVARLSTMLRWNLSVHHAGIYRSLLYLLLVIGANPTVHRLEAGTQQRIRATTRCAELFGDRSSASSDADERRDARQQVRQALLALDASSALHEGEQVEAESAASPGKRLRDTFAEEGAVLRHLPLADERVVEVLCLRVLPHARPGSARQLRFAPPNVSPSFRGYPLQYIEVLPTWSHTPEEILNHLRAAHLSDKAKEASAGQEPGVTLQPDPCWLEKHEEPYILVCAMKARTMRSHLRTTASRFSDVVESGPMTVRQLSVITLWAHEYGAEMAAEMLFVLLLLNPHFVRLRPPAAACEGGAGADAAARRNYGEWVVELR